MVGDSLYQRFTPRCLCTTDHRRIEELKKHATSPCSQPELVVSCTIHACSRALAHTIQYTLRLEGDKASCERNDQYIRLVCGAAITTIALTLFALLVPLVHAASSLTTLRTLDEF